MHLVYLTERIDITGGIERSLTTRVNYLVKKYNYNITIVCTEKESGIPAYKIDDSVKIIFLENLTTKKSTFGRVLLRYNQSRMIVNRLKPDILITVKYTLHNLFFRFLKKNIKLISEIREPKEQYNHGRNLNIKSKLNASIRDYILKKQDVMIVLTKADKKSWGYKNIEVIPNMKTIHSDIVSDLSNLKVLAIGRLHKVKGFDKLIDVWSIVSKKHPNWKLKICGEGSEFQALSNKIAELNLEKSINLTNKFLPVIPEFLNSSIFVLTSQFEAFGNVLVESKICGVPIVAFDAPNGPREIIIQGKDGYIVPLNNINEMATKINYLIENPQERIKMGVFARKDTERFNVETVVEAYNKVIFKNSNFI